MNGNICPNCGKPVMPYSRFIREAEPYKISECGSCSVKLKRSPRVYKYLIFMFIIFAGVSIPLFLGMVQTYLSSWIMWSMAIIWFACWVVLINYLSWHYIGWVVVEKENN
jgi:uncharacterized protein (DUF983 family)